MALQAEQQQAGGSAAAQQQPASMAGIGLAEGVSAAPVWSTRDASLPQAQQGQAVPQAALPPAFQAHLDDEWDDWLDPGDEDIG